MKQKFETNVASDIPKTKLHEPELPWKLNEDEAWTIGSMDDGLRAAISGTPPLKTRVPFLILLVVVIFVITAYLVASAVFENERMRGNIAKKESELSLVQMNLLRAVAEKDNINKNSVQLEKKINDLTAQKQLFAGIIESLTKKGEDIDMPQATPILAMTPAVNASADAGNNAAQPSGSNTPAVAPQQ